MTQSKWHSQNDKVKWQSRNNEVEITKSKRRIKIWQGEIPEERNSHGFMTSEYRRHKKQRQIKKIWRFWTPIQIQQGTHRRRISWSNSGRNAHDYFLWFRPCTWSCYWKKHHWFTRIRWIHTSILEIKTTDKRSYKYIWSGVHRIEKCNRTSNNIEISFTFNGNKDFQANKDFCW